MLQLGLVLVFIAPVQGGTQYPLFEGAVTPIEAAFEEQILKGYPLIRQLSAPAVDTRVPVEQIQGLLQAAASRVALHTWPVVQADGKMPLPQVLITNEGINSGLDSLFRVEALSSTPERVDLLAYALLWNTLLDQHPTKAFEIMAGRARSADVTSVDVLTITASLSTMPGGRALREVPRKDDWAAMLRSSNPCYQFLALEYFESVPQSGDELLSLYRRCLFDSCSYLEARALVAIGRRKDYRESVAHLLDDYVMSSPVHDDGTASKIRILFDDRAKSAADLARYIREHIAKHGEKKTAAVLTKGSGGNAVASSGHKSSNGSASGVSAQTRDLRITVAAALLFAAGAFLWWLRRSGR